MSPTKVLKILSSGRFIFRSLAGICREANEEESAVLKTFISAGNAQLGRKGGGKNGVRWHITEKAVVLEAHLNTNPREQNYVGIQACEGCCFGAVCHSCTGGGAAQ